MHTWFLNTSQPVYAIVSAPHQVAETLSLYLADKKSLQRENAKLYTENLVLQAKVQKLNALTVENVRLRELLNSARSEEHNALVAEVVAVSPNPYSHYVLVNKGSKDGVFVSQSAVDADGLFGQVVEVADKHSKIMLISDHRHGVPVQVDRSAVHLLIEGQGNFNQLSIPFVTATTDLVEGDVLTSSGLGGVFPANYPVARVVNVTHEPGQAFATVEAKPFAHLDKARHILLLFPQTMKND